MIFDLLIIFTFQSIYGYVFSWIGLFVAFFMAGSACGAKLTTGVLKQLKKCFVFFMSIELAIICFSFGLPFLFLVIHTYTKNTQLLFLFPLLFIIISFICGLLVGSEFSLANKLYLKHSKSVSKTAGVLYASDLMGGWCGGIVGAVLLLPVLGLTGTCITVGWLKVASFIVITTGYN